MEKYENSIDIIAENLIYYRKKANLTQNELAEKLNYSDKSISKWERKEGLPDILILIKLAKIYGLTVNDFLTQKKKERVANRFLSKILITLLSFALVAIVFTLLFAILEIFTNIEKTWLMFVYAIPVICIIWIVFNDVFFKRIYNIYVTAILLWSVISSIYLTIEFNNSYMLFIVGIPIQIFLILLYLLILKRKK